MAELSSLKRSTLNLIYWSNLYVKTESTIFISIKMANITLVKFEIASFTLKEFYQEAISKDSKPTGSVAPIQMQLALIVE